MTHTNAQKLAPLFQPFKFGSTQTANRIWMAPITRNRAHEDGTPHIWAKTYYGQRATAGLIVTEATNISPTAIGYIKTPGIFTQSHIDGWKPITEEVHKKGGKIFLQLWHVGRISHTSLLPKGSNQFHPPQSMQICKHLHGMALNKFLNPVSLK